MLPISHFLYFLLLVSSGTVDNDPTEQGGKDDGYDIFLLIGQSNMAGRGYLLDGDEHDMDGVWLLNAEGLPEVAINPLNKYSTIRKEIGMQQMGPGYSFATTLHSETGKKILLVVNARGGSALSEWKKGAAAGFYEQAIERTRLATRHGKLRGILWHQGESDSANPEKYLEDLSAIVSSLRTDLAAPEVPFVAGEIARWHQNAPLFNPEINRIRDVIENSACVLSEGIGQLIDDSDPHFDRNGQLILGRRYAEKILEMCY